MILVMLWALMPGEEVERPSHAKVDDASGIENHKAQ